MYLREDGTLSKADHWDVYDRGPRLYVFPTNLEAALSSLATTALLFEPWATQGILNILYIPACIYNGQNISYTILFSFLP